MAVIINSISLSLNLSESQGKIDYVISANSMEQSPWGAIICSSSQEISHILWNLNTIN
jgi:hypothetical protein